MNWEDLEVLMQLSAMTFLVQDCAFTIITFYMDEERSLEAWIGNWMFMNN